MKAIYGQNFRSKFLSYSFFTRLDIPAKGHWVAVEEEQGNPF
jgi:hypothetical protein